LKANHRGGVNECVVNALKKAFLNLDDEFYSSMQDISIRCGAAAVAVLIIGNRAYCANVGDSRAVLCRN
jgi:serine/threonine protein phosphatase PrpC